MVTVTAYNALIVTASAAIALGDNATALPSLLAAQALLAGLPDTRAGEHALTWSRTDLEAAIARCKAAIGTTRGLQLTSFGFGGVGGKAV